jgi:hypothetical protein
MHVVHELVWAAYFLTSWIFTIATACDKWPISQSVQPPLDQGRHSSIPRVELSIFDDVKMSYSIEADVRIVALGVMRGRDSHGRLLAGLPVTSLVIRQRQFRVPSDKHTFFETSVWRWKYLIWNTNSHTVCMTNVNRPSYVKSVMRFLWSILNSTESWVLIYDDG